MADNHVNISIGSSFNGEGFNQLAKAAEGVTKTTSKVMNSVGQIGNAIGGLDNTLGKVTGAISNMLGAFALGGPIGLAIAGVTALVGWIGKIKKEAEEARNKLDEMAKATEKARIEKAFKDAEKAVKDANNALSDHLKALNDAANAADRLAKAEKSVADAQERLNNAQDNQQMANLKSDIQQRVQANSWSPSQAKIEQAKGNVEIQQLANQQALDDAAKEVKNAKEKLRDATNELNSLELTRTQVQDQIDGIENTLSNAIEQQKIQLTKLKYAEEEAEANYSTLAKTIGVETTEAVKAKEQLNNARAERERAEERIANTEKTASEQLVKAKNTLKDINIRIAEKSAAEEVAAAELNIATTNLETARTQAETAEKEVKRQLDELVIATNNERKAREDAAEAERKAKELKADADSKIRDAEINAAKQINGIDKQMKKLKTAIKNAETAMQNAANGVAWANQNNWGGWGHQEFNPNNFDDFRRAGRFGNRANRDNNRRKPGKNRQAGWEKREEELAKRLGLSKKEWDNLTDKEFEDLLNGKQGRKLRNDEKNWLRDKRDWDNQQNKGNNQNQLERLQQQRQLILQNLENNVKEIKDNLKEALTVK